MRCMWICISSQLIVDLGRLTSSTVTGWGRSIPGRGGVAWLRPSGEVAPGPVHPHCGCGFCAMPVCQRALPAVSIWPNIPGSLFIASFTFLCPGNWPR
jgi:hypothetical protein